MLDELMLFIIDAKAISYVASAFVKVFAIHAWSLIVSCNSNIIS